MVVSLKQRREVGYWLSISHDRSRSLRSTAPALLSRRYQTTCWDWEDGWSRVHGHQYAVSHTGERHLYWTSSAFTVEWSGKEPQQGAGNLPEAMLGSLWGNRGAGPDQGCWCEWAQKLPHGRSATFWSYTTYSVNLEAIPSSWKQMSSRF